MKPSGIAVGLTATHAPRVTPRPASLLAFTVLASFLAAGCHSKIADCNAVIAVHNKHDEQAQGVQFDAPDSGMALAGIFEAEAKELAAMSSLEDEGVKTRAKAMADATGAMARAMRDMGSKTKAMEDAVAALKAVSPTDVAKLEAQLAATEKLVEEQEAQQVVNAAASATQDAAVEEFSRYCGAGRAP